MIYLLGHKIAAVGFSEALNLVSSSKLGEKLTVSLAEFPQLAVCELARNAKLQGYTYASIVMLNAADLSSSIIECLKLDIHSGKELPMTLALNCISTVAGKNILTQLQGPIANFVLLRYFIYMYIYVFM